MSVIEPPEAVYEPSGIIVFISVMSSSFVSTKAASMLLFSRAFNVSFINPFTAFFLFASMSS